MYPGYVTPQSVVGIPELLHGLVGMGGVHAHLLERWTQDATGPASEGTALIDVHAEANSMAVRATEVALCQTERPAKMHRRVFIIAPQLLERRPCQNRTRPSRPGTVCVRYRQL